MQFIINYFHANGGFLRATGTPQNERKKREKKQKTDKKNKKVTSAGERTGGAVVVEEAFFFNGVKPLPWLGRNLMIGGLPRSGLNGGGKSGGGGIT